MKKTIFVVESVPGSTWNTNERENLVAEIRRQIKEESPVIVLPNGRRLVPLDVEVTEGVKQPDVKIHLEKNNARR